MEEHGDNHVVCPRCGDPMWGDEGQVHAEAELAWPPQRVAVLHGEQVENTAAFEQASWRTFPADDDVAERIPDVVLSSPCAEREDPSD